MTRRRFTEDEFVELWQRHKSAAKVARATGLDICGVHERRRPVRLPLYKNFFTSSSITSPPSRSRR